MALIPASLMRPAVRLASAAFRVFEPETAHSLSIRALKAGFVPDVAPPDDPRLNVTVAGLFFPNPVGLAAGFDKNAEVPDAILRMGFGYTEVGTLTPLAQEGNPKPRLFRLTRDGAVINRMGFNNDGHDAAEDRLKARLKRSHVRGGLIGINVGANKLSEDRVADYVTGISRFAPYASYFTINISSPNTPGLRDLQARSALDDLLRRALVARDETAQKLRHNVPVFLKIAPDLTNEGIQDVVDVALERGIDGLIISNTTLSRDGLTDRQQAETGGLSGAPLFHRSTAMLAHVRRLVGPELPIIGVGGIHNADTAWAKLAAGADLIQIYSAMVYQGAGLAAEICDGLLKRLSREGLTSISAVSGSAVDEWADQWTR